MTTTFTSSVEYLPIAGILINGGTQSRVKLNWDVIAEYAEAITLDAVFPPILVFYDGKNYWLADGFHRLHATKKAGRQEITVEIHQGSRRDALLYSVGANANHGLRRTNADKRRAVDIMLQDEEWSHWSNREIAKRCGVSEFMVRQMRQSICDKNADTKKRTVQRQGKTYTVDTTHIGEAMISTNIAESSKQHPEDGCEQVLCTDNPQQSQCDDQIGVLVQQIDTNTYVANGTQTPSFQESEVQLFNRQPLSNVHQELEHQSYPTASTETINLQDIIIDKIAMEIIHLSPEQLSKIIFTSANNGLSKFHLNTIIEAAKQALNDGNQQQYLHKFYALPGMES
ncbi:ParB/Srx family N-terminal domain-containing protein [Brasilonema sp. UFV-L1]|uniref:ParB/Srx family N-terminal domain-containing protein n=1 Tax=Brasilonema sp. UFV-L1 TaxID=2234130 RepID=UPI00145D7A23|nr:ParB/Srx family N-terminal domain-containing protein [Brasilonema sp. UFV-L1]NMG07196.1 hypothetical protein [Brasilonema sp. UFV-L1]